MKPTNSRERRIQFLNFILLFLLAVLPIVTVVYAYARVDAVENKVLEAEYVKHKSDSQVTGKHRELLGTVVRRGSTLRATVISYSGKMKRFFENGESVDGNLRTELQEYRREIDALAQYDMPNRPDTALIDLANDFLLTAEELTAVYVDGYAMSKINAIELKSKKDALEASDKLLKTCNDDLATCKKLNQ